ncbi:MAG: hypothetical protein R3B89_23195 [Polyangiaceae bacterium]
MHPLLAFLNTHLLADTSMWSAPVFQKDVWTGVMRAVRYLLTFGGAVLLMYEIRARKLRQPLKERTMKGLAVLFTVLAFGAYFDFGNPNTRYSEYYHRHEFYHYYLGSKYFEELGYARLYECSAGGHWAGTLTRCRWKICDLAWAICDRRCRGLQKN